MLTPLSGGKNPPNTGSSFIYSHPHRVPTPSLFASQGNTPEALAATPAPALTVHPPVERRRARASLTHVTADG